MSKARLIPTIEEGKVLPQAIDFETSVLGTILTLSNSIYSVINIIKEDMFYKDEHKQIYKAMRMLIKENIIIDTLSVCNQLRKNGCLDEVGGTIYISSLLNTYSTDNIEYYARMIAEAYLRRRQIEISDSSKKNAYDPTKDVFENYDNQINALEKTLNFNPTPRGFKHQTKQTMNVILSKDKDIAYYKLYDDKFASFIQLTKRRTIVFPSAQGAGKTSFMSWIMEGLCELNENIAVYCFSLEDPYEDMIMKFVSRRVRLTIKQLKSIDYTLTEEDIKNIELAFKVIESYNIEFIDTPCNFDDIKRNTKRFKDKNPTKDIVVIIDNFGKISRKGMGFDTIEQDKMLVEGICDMANEGDLCVLMPHHILKDAMSKDNFKDAYRIRTSSVKGAGELLNYFPQCYTINRPSMFPDVADAYKSTTSSYLKYTDTPTQDDFERDIWALNPEGNLTNSWVTLKVLLTSQSEKDGEGNFINYSHIVNKYREYVNSIKQKNADREERYKTKIKEFSVYLNEKMYMQNTASILPPFDSYIYGDLNPRPKLSSMFIVEAIRDRYNDFTDKNIAIFRYKHELKYNNFIIL